MIAVLEPTYGKGDHAAVNAALIQATALAFPEERMVFAATPCQRRAVQEVASLPRAIGTEDIAVLPPGGVSLRRGLTQWRNARRLLFAYRPRAVVLLSSGPETFFAVRSLAAEFTEATFFVVLHGNLTNALGWRSRDPRRRLFDYRAGLARLRHPRISLVVLAEHIRRSAAELGVAPGCTMLAWPHPLNAAEIHPGTALPAAGPPRVAFIGTATRGKGFDRFLALTAALRSKQAAGQAAENCTFRVIGHMPDAAEIPAASALEYPLPGQPLERAEFLSRIRAVDYVLLPMAENYELTASGSLLDCLAQAKPVIAFDVAGVREIAANHGDVGFICPSMASMQALLADGSALRNPAAYDGFRRNLRDAAQARTPAALAMRLRSDLGPNPAAPERAGGGQAAVSRVEHPAN